ncbi:MAG: aminodeoxychorismate/anthranilate synthase component II [Syntrophaceae bacterium]
MILMIDNFDSFTFNIVQAFVSSGEEVVVRRNNAVTISEIEALGPRGIVISPGPGTPESAGISLEVIRHYHTRVPILGVCLGHQCLGEAFGGRIVHAGRVMHGKLSTITHDSSGLFAGLPRHFKAVRYHSLVVDRHTCPESLKICALSEDGEIMGLKHADYPLYGVQFHPESIAAEYGYDILRAFSAVTREEL